MDENELPQFNLTKKCQCKFPLKAPGQHEIEWLAKNTNWKILCWKHHKHQCTWDGTSQPITHIENTWTEKIRPVSQKAYLTFWGQLVDLLTKEIKDKKEIFLSFFFFKEHQSDIKNSKNNTAIVRLTLNQNIKINFNNTKKLSNFNNRTYGYCREAIEIRSNRATYHWRKSIRRREKGE